jgi:hypothetical protein
MSPRELTRLWSWFWGAHLGASIELCPVVSWCQVWFDLSFHDMGQLGPEVCNLGV